MQKLLKVYLNQPTISNAFKLVNYAKRHPMAECLLTQYDQGLLQDAKCHIAGSLERPSQRVVL